MKTVTIEQEKSLDIKVETNAENTIGIYQTFGSHTDSISVKPENRTKLAMAISPEIKQLVEALEKIKKLPQTIGHAYRMQDIASEALRNFKDKI